MNESHDPRRLTDEVERIRRFNRFYTGQIGLLEESFLRSPFSLTQVRVLQAIARGSETTAAEVAQALRLDPGYLSRLLRRLRKKGLVDARPSAADGRIALLTLSAEGSRIFRELDEAQNREVEALLERVPAADRSRLVTAMMRIQWLLGDEPDEPIPYILRPHRSGELGWVVHRHGVLYTAEYGWGDRFEGLVARVVADFVAGFDPTREHCWIAERQGEPVGSVFLVRHPDRPGVARLRLLLVEPRARGLGIGAGLVRECSHFARQAGYRRITLWTNRVLHSARRIYEAEGYRLVCEAPHQHFGEGLVGQDWEMEL